MTISANYPTIRPSLSLDFANTEQLDPRITFSRPTTAAYYDANTTALAEQNLLLQSQALATTPWGTAANGVSAPTVTNNAGTAPDGTTTATQINCSAITSGQFCYSYQAFSTPSGLNCTESIWLQSVSGTCTAYLEVEISGVRTSVACNLTTTWQRFSLPFTSGSAQYFIIGLDTRPTSSPSSQAAANFYAWGAQLEQRSSVTAYNATTTTAITNYIPVLLTAPTNQARFDHDPVARTSLGLLIEQQSTNLVTYSGALDNAAWGQVNCTVNANTKIAPDGTLTATKIVENTTASVAHYLQEGVTVTTATSYTTTVYMKAGERTWGYILENSGVSAQAYFNLSTGVVGTVSGTGSPSATITSVGNGWYRCSMTFTSSGTSAGVRFGPASADNTKTYTGDGYSGVFTWGAQLEALAFPTSYIPTQASQVIRSADSASMTGTNFSSWYAGSENTWYVNFQYPSLFSANRSVIGSNINTNMMYNYNNTVVTYDGTNYSTNATTFTANQNCKFAVAQSSIASTQISSFNGTSGSTVAYNKAYFSNTYITIASPNNSGVSYIKKISYYPTALTSTNLIALTGS